MQCQAQSTIAHWDFSMMMLEKDLLKLHCSEEFATAIIAQMSSWHNGTTAPLPNSYSTPTRILVEAQAQIGWNLLLDGCIHTSWGMHMKEILIHKGSKMTPRCWAVAIIKKCGTYHGTCGIIAMEYYTK